MPYIFGKLWHLAIIWAIRKAFQCILQGVRILLAKYTRISPTSENESYIELTQKPTHRYARLASFAFLALLASFASLALLALWMVSRGKTAVISDFV